MPLSTRVAPDRLQRRMCLSCGHDGPSLQREPLAAILVCPNCGADLYSRPPRTYAEMEALGESFSARPSVTTFDRLSRLLLTIPDRKSEARPRRRMLARIGGSIAAIAVVAAVALVATLLARH